MENAVLAKTANRSVVGVLNELGHLAAPWRPSAGNFLDLSLRLATVPFAANLGRFTRSQRDLIADNGGKVVSKSSQVTWKALIEKKAHHAEMLLEQFAEIEGSVVGGVSRAVCPDCERALATRGAHLMGPIAPIRGDKTGFRRIVWDRSRG